MLGPHARIAQEVPSPVQQHRECYPSAGQCSQSYRCQDTVGDQCAGSTESCAPAILTGPRPTGLCLLSAVEVTPWGKRFKDRGELMYVIQQFNRSLDSGWFGDMFQKSVKRHCKCIAHNGEYFEKG